MYKAARVPVRDEDGNGSINHESDETSHGTDEGGALHNVVQQQTSEQIGDLLTKTLSQNSFFVSQEEVATLVRIDFY
jgi:hypothetical protein